MSERLIHSLTFRPDGLVELSFAELREEVENAAMLRTVVFDEPVFGDEVDDLRDFLNDLIDEVLIYLRNDDARQTRLEASRRTAPAPDTPPQEPNSSFDDF